MEASNSSSYASEKRKQNRKASLKKALFGRFRSARIHQKNKSSRINVLSKAASIAKVNSLDGIDVLSQSSQEDNGAVRLKILVKKVDLEQFLELMRNNNDDNNSDNSHSNYHDNDNGDDEEDEEATSWKEERLNQLRKKRRCQTSWSPTLQTIPEEILA